MARTFYHSGAASGFSAAPPAKAAPLNEPILWKCLLLAALTYLIWNDQLSIVLDLSPSPVGLERPDDRSGQRVKAAMLPEIQASSAPKERPRAKAQVVMPAGAKGHVTFLLDPGFAERNGIAPSVAARAMTKCKEYIDRFAPVAVAEMRKFGIPASIILAQGLLESNAGESDLAQSTNNHFGIKCFSNRCKTGHCANFSDDSHKDFFVRYTNVWSSYRAHSNLLKNSKRYASLFKLAADDYKNWARGLLRAGYATDPHYAEKLVALIQNLELDRFDQQ